MKGFKTLVFGAIITALGGIQAMDLAGIVPESLIGIVMAGIGVVVMVLRMLTDTPVTKSTPTA